MKIIKLDLKKRSYNIVVGCNTINLLGENLRRLKLGTCAYLITNAAIKNKYGKTLNTLLKRSGFQVKFRLVEDSEKSKSLESAYAVIKDITLFDHKREIFILALGGGVIGDLAGFIASIYKRGIPYVQVPTTLLAQVDSAIGGKTALDLSQGKNLVGTFYQPRLVFSDVAILRTLPIRQLEAGLAEIIKYGIIKDPQLFNYLEKNYKGVLSLKSDVLEFIVSRCSAIKAKVVQQDEREERGIRTILNFGHTIGHAIEAAGNYKRYNHGEAIALGMLVASGMSNLSGLLDIKIARRIEDLIEKAGLPTKIKRITLSDIINAQYRDKKFIGGKNRFVLIKDIGKTEICRNIPLRIIKAALDLRI